MEILSRKKVLPEVGVFISVKALSDDYLHILDKWDHNNILHILHSGVDRNYVHVASEFSQNSDLSKPMVNHSQGLLELKVLFLMRELFSALTSMHEISIIHGALRMKHILLAANRSVRLICSEYILLVGATAVSSDEPCRCDMSSERLFVAHIISGIDGFMQISHY